MEITQISPTQVVTEYFSFVFFPFIYLSFFSLFFQPYMIIQSSPPSTLRMMHVPSIPPHSAVYITQKKTIVLN